MAYIKKYNRCTIVNKSAGMLMDVNCQQNLITGRNEVLAKVIFSQASVILLTGWGVPDQAHPPGRYTPPAGTPLAGTPPSRQVHPPGRYTPLPGRYTPLQAGTPPSRQVQPPLPGRYTPPPGRYTPPRKQQTPEYGQRSAGTHPTGMHSR